MAGYSKAFFAGSTGGFMGSDGLARPFLMILQGESDRQWLEPVYEGGNVQPLRGIRILIPRHPDDRAALVDALLVFLPQLFEQCGSFGKAVDELPTGERLELADLQASATWQQLREEALPIIRGIGLFEAELQRFEV